MDVGARAWTDAVEAMKRAEEAALRATAAHARARLLADRMAERIDRRGSTSGPRIPAQRPPSSSS